MLRKVSKLIVMATAVVAMLATAAQAQNVTRDYQEDDRYADYDGIRIDRYLDVEIWTNHSDGEYYEGDNIVLSFRSNRDAFVAIYSIDSRDRVSLLFPSEPNENNYIRGGVTYRLPAGDDDFDLVITGPEGVENIQIIASRERFPIPDWFPTSGLICDWEDRFDYMDYINNRHFVGYGGQRFAYDRTSVYVNEWEPVYFRPVYYPVYPSWTVCGNVYIDYPYGGTVYINGIYWGCVPLYVPRMYVGWHTITIYDYYGYCWESDVHISRYHTVVLGGTIVRTLPTVMSKYKKVRFVGYRDPVKHGYPGFKKAKMIGMSASAAATGPSAKDQTVAIPKKHVRGSAKVIKTERGYETTGGVRAVGKKGKSVRGSPSKGRTSLDALGGSTSKSKAGASSSSKYESSSGISGSKKSSGKVEKWKRSAAKESSGSSRYYQKKSGTSHKKKSASAGAAKKSGKSYDGRKSSKGSSSADGKKSSTYRKSGSSGKSKSAGSGKKSQKSKSSGAVKSSDGKSSKPAPSPPAKGSSGSKKSSGKGKTSGGKSR